VFFPAGKNEPEIFGERVEIDGLEGELGLVASLLAPALCDANQSLVGSLIRSTPKAPWSTNRTHTA